MDVPSKTRQNPLRVTTYKGHRKFFRSPRPKLLIRQAIFEIGDGAGRRNPSITKVRNTVFITLRSVI